MDASERNPLRTLAAVGAVAAGAALLVTASYELSRERIAANQRERLVSSLHTVLDPRLHDNDLAETRLSVTDAELLGTAEPVDVYVATMGAQPVAVLLTPVAPDGYNGPIRLLIGVLADGTVTGVRVVTHRETPGLGDAIEIGKSRWILMFDGASLEAPPPNQWAVARDGGSFDSLTGATITARAVIQGVRNSLLYFDRHRDELFAAAAELHETNESADD